MNSGDISAEMVEGLGALIAGVDVDFVSYNIQSCKYYALSSLNV